MKKLLAYSVVFALLGCDADTIVTPNTSVVNLGVPSETMLVTGASSPITSGPYSVSVEVTPEATYSFQLTHINGTILDNYGFTATSSIMTINLDYSQIPVGAYDLVLMDNTGRLLKTAVIIQR